LPADVANDSTSKELVLASEEELALATSSVSTSAASSEVRSDALEEDEEPASRLSLSRSSSRLSLSAIDLADGSKKVLSHNEKKFFKAIQEDNVEVIRTLLTTKSFQLSKTYEDGENALLYALRKGKGAVAKFLLDEGADSLAANKRGKNCLHYAARGDFKRELQDALVSSEAITIINDVDEAGETPLVAAIRSGNVQFAKLLVSQETCDVNLADKELISPLMRACIKRHAGMVLLLSDTGRLCFDQVDKVDLHSPSHPNPLALLIVFLSFLAEWPHRIALRRLQQRAKHRHAAQAEWCLHADRGHGETPPSPPQLTMTARQDCKLPIDYSADPEITAELAEVISAPPEKSEPEPELSLTFLSPTAVPAPQSLVPPNSCAAEVVDGIPALIPDVLDAAAFEALLRQGNNAALFPAELVAAMKDPTASITRDELLEQCAGTDVFLTHDWGIDQFGRDNHMRVLRVNEALKKLGIVTWFDKDRMDGDVIQQMCDGIERTQLVVTFITQVEVPSNFSSFSQFLLFSATCRRSTATAAMTTVGSSSSTRSAARPPRTCWRWSWRSAAWPARSGRGRWAWHWVARSSSTT
jgi:ankyrin repeat protein